MKKIFLTLTLIFVALLVSHAQTTPLWLRNSAISPDGTTIAFTYKGNIFTVPVTGGLARQITSHPSHSTSPVWSPNSDKLAFASNREGNFDVFITNLQTGSMARVTSHSANEFPQAFLDNNTVLFSAFIQPVAQSQQFPTPMFTQIFSVSENGERPRLFSALHMENLSKNGNLWLYTDKKGYEDPWRKRHTSSITRNIWLFDAENNTHRQLTTFEGENRNAVWASDGVSFYYLSEQGGSFNVFRSDINGGTPVQITHFQTHPVRFLSIDKNDNLSFSFHGELYVMKRGETPQRVDLQIISDNFEREVIQQMLTTGAQSIAVSPNGKEIAFIARGNVFVTSIEFATTRRITDHVEQDRNVDFSPDGRSLIYSSQRGGTWNIFKTELVRDEDRYFIHARELRETQLTHTETPSFQPIFSPDGKEIAFLENRSEIRVLNLETMRTRTVMDSRYNFSYTDGDQWFQWSPDGRWIVTDYIGIGGWNNKDVALFNADGSGERTNLTQSGYMDIGARFVMDGRAILFFSDRAGFRSHGSWGAHRDAYLMFLTLDAADDFRMTREERALRARIEAADTTENRANNRRANRRSNRNASEIEPLVFDLDNHHRRIVRLTRHSSSLYDAHLNEDASRLYYLARFEDGVDLWVQDFLENTTRLLIKNVGAGRLIADRNNNNLYLVSGGNIRKIENDRITNVTFSAPFNHRPAQERAHIFEHIWTLTNDKFHDVNMHGVDWAMYGEEYRRFLPHINNNFDFAEMLGEMLGELNASHTGARFNPGPPSWQTATLGVFWDDTHTGNGLKIKEIIKGSPLIRANSRLRPGVIIERIDGELIEAGKTYWHLLNGKAGQNVLLTAFDGRNRFEEIVRPITYAQQNNLLYFRWVEQRQALVERYSNGRIGYVHVRAMNSQSFRDVYRDLLGRFRNHEAVVVDTRFNGGGWLHDDLVTLLGGVEYQRFTPRGVFIGSDPFNKWTRPSIVLMGEGNYSNAHGFPWVYRELGIGKLVGAPVPGTMTAVWWETQIDPTLVFGIPQVTVEDMRGVVMENTQLYPDIKVFNTPESLLSNDDLQLKRAVEELLRQLDAD